MPLFLNTEAVVIVRHIWLHRAEGKRGILKQEDGYLTVEPVPSDIAPDKVLVTLSDEIDEALEPVYPLKGFCFVGSEIMF